MKNITRFSEQQTSQSQVNKEKKLKDIIIQI